MRRRLVVPVVAVALALAGCQVDATVTVDVTDDGSGTVTVEVALDAEAVEQVPGLEAQLRTDDLEATGWTVTGPEGDGAGGRTITATKPFADPDAMGAVLEEVGVLTDAALARERPFGQVTYDFAATVDLSDGVEAFGDEDLTELLGGLAIGRDVAALEDELGAPLSDLSSFELVVNLPEGDEVVTSTLAVDLGDDPATLEAETTETDPWAVGLRWAAVGFGALLVLLLLWRLVRLVRRRRQGPSDA